MIFSFDLWIKTIKKRKEKGTDDFESKIRIPMDQPVSGRNIGGIKQTQISGLLCKYTNVVKGWCLICLISSLFVAVKNRFNDKTDDKFLWYPF